LFFPPCQKVTIQFAFRNASIVIEISLRRHAMRLHVENKNASVRLGAAVLALVATALFSLVPVSAAQSHPTTSSSSGHTATTAAAAHSTSWASSSTTSSSSTAHTAPSTPSRNNAPVRRSRGYWRGGIYYPYAVTGSGTTEANNASGNSEAECQGGPTIFERCSSASGSYIPTMSEGPAHASAPQSSFAGAANSSADSFNPTTLVFKDGHEVEVDNYAVAGHTLYDLTPGSPQKIALSDLDLSATQKQNHDRGAVFELPPSAHSN
jgi:hypothetical protein